MASLILLLAACRPGEGVVPTTPSGLTGTTAATADTGWTTAPVEPHNVLVLLTDDQGTDKVGVYGEHPEPPPTPRMDALAAEGVLFRNAWATPICSPTRAALLTGRLGRRTGLGGVIQFMEGKELPLPEITIPEMLVSAEQAWATAAVGKWHLGAFNALSGMQHPNLQGFDTFRGSMGNLYDVAQPDGQPHNYFYWEKISDGVVAKVDRYATTDTVDDALQLMAAMPEPWFLYVAFNAPHKPLDPPPPALHSFGQLSREKDGEKVLYHAVVEAMDTEIGRLLDTMDAGVRERTTIVLAGDNGTPDHAILPPWDPGRGKETPFEGGVNVPLIVAGPLVEQPGSETAALVHIVDVFATVAHIAGVDPSTLGVPMDGDSLVPLIRDPMLPGRATVHTERFLPVGPPPYNVVDWRITRDDRFKIIESEDQNEVFDLAGRDDDGEVLDVAVLPLADRTAIDALIAAHDAFWTPIEGPEDAMIPLLLTFDGQVPDDGLDHFFVDFDVPEGVLEIEFRHDDLSDANVLDWGLDDPDGFRGWGGGNDEPAIVNWTAASRSYLAGVIQPGTWRVVVGKAKIAEPPGEYHIELELRFAETLLPQPERRPFEDPGELSGDTRWYAGDLHVHSHESGDASATFDEIADLARERGLDFVVITDHNTVSQHELLTLAQSRHADVLLIPGMEFTTYDGHANAFMPTGWVDHRIGQPGATIEAAVDAFLGQEALVSINHPELDLGDACIGCSWGHAVPDGVVGIEVGTGGWEPVGQLFTPLVLPLWEQWTDEGHRLAAIGGSDDHRAGTDTGPFASPIGSPTTQVWSEGLSIGAVLDGIEARRTVVQLQDATDPMVELQGDQGEVTATVTGGGDQLVWVVDGVLGEQVPIDADPFQATVPLADGRVRAEVWVAGSPRTVTSHVFADELPGPGTSPALDDKKCGCATGSSGSWIVGVLAATLGRRWNTRAPRRTRWRAERPDSV